jgi:outer membrane protein OmpA-like peptidoglycan-associated protein
MKGVAQRWIVAQVAGMSLIAGAGTAFAADVTDADRTYRNFFSETATVSEREVRLEGRGLMLQESNTTKENLYGLLFPRGQVDSLTGGVLELLGSYGLAKNAEVGFDIPGFIQSVNQTDGTTVNESGIGDLQLYGKFKYSVAQHCDAGAGVQMSLPNGSEDKGFGTGDLGLTPFVSAQYQRGPVRLGINTGYQFFTGDATNVYQYGAEAIWRASSTYAFRTEIAGRVYNQRGVTWNDLAILPGIDFNFSDNLTFRPTGYAGLTTPAFEWGIGIGVAYNFTVPSLAAAPVPVAEAPPPPPPPPVKEKIVLRGVHFDFDKANIRADARPILDQAVETLKEHGAVHVTVAGYTDSIGSEEYNQRLSVRRADAVRDYLVEHGIDASRLSVVGHGESDPVASNDTEDGRAQNRRVELLVAQ